MESDRPGGGDWRTVLVADQGAPWTVSFFSPSPAVVGRGSMTLMSERGCRGWNQGRHVSVGSAVAPVALVVSVEEGVPRYQHPW